MTCYVTTTRAATREEWAEVVKLGSLMSWEQFEAMQTFRDSGGVDLALKNVIAFKAEK